MKRIILDTPLSTEEIERMVDMRVGLWTNHLTGQTYLNKIYWREIGQGRRDAIIAVLQHLRREEAGNE